MPLVHERAWSRTFRHPDNKMIFWIPRFLDGSASMTFEALRRGWGTWSESERRDFSKAAAWLRAQTDFVDMLRLMVSDGDTRVLSSIAQSVAHALPQEESFGILCSALTAADLADSANFLQAIAMTRHPAARAAVRARLDQILATPYLWAAERYGHHLAVTAICGVKYAVETGTDPGDLEPAVRALAAHPTTSVRESCPVHLQRWYPWLSPPSTGA
jgi:hypothetical protein